MQTGDGSARSSLCLRSTGADVRVELPTFADVGGGSTVVQFDTPFAIFQWITEGLAGFRIKQVKQVGQVGGQWPGCAEGVAVAPFADREQYFGFRQGAKRIGVEKDSGIARDYPFWILRVGLESQDAVIATSNKLVLLGANTTQQAD